MNIEVANRIRSAAAARGLKLYQLAANCGTTAANLSILLNHVNEPKESALRAIAGALGVSLEWLLNGDDYSIAVMLDKGAHAPTRAHKADAGLDIYLPEGKAVKVRAHKAAVIDTGVHIAIPAGYVGMLKSKSGLNVKHGLVSEGVIDSGYTGSIKVKLYNHSASDYTFESGNKISQLVIIPCITPAVKLVEAFPSTERGENGFGSTGR